MTNNQKSPIEGLRLQIFYVLKALKKGQAILVQHEIKPDLSERQKEQLLKEMKSSHFWIWTEAQKIHPIIVPGTIHFYPVFKTLLKYKWIMPLEKSHWLPDMRYYILSPDGEKSLNRSILWWKNMSFFQKILVHFVE